MNETRINAFEGEITEQNVTKENAKIDDAVMEDVSGGGLRANPDMEPKIVEKAVRLQTNDLGLKR